MMLEYYIAAAVILAVYVIALVICFVIMYRQRLSEYSITYDVCKELESPKMMVYDFMALDPSAEKLLQSGDSGQITIDDVIGASALNAEVMSNIETNGIDEIKGNYVPKDF
ncbi:MAG: hypothetical protein LUD51_02730 [Clostridia bacterium]|nr:hypothetical protein [Clostridia bacterium]